MKRLILFGFILVLIGGVEPLAAQIPCEEEWDNIDTLTMGGVLGLPPEELVGQRHVLVIASVSPGDLTQGWTSLEMPAWLSDSFIAPFPYNSTQVKSNQYKWSISNFWAAASGGLDGSLFRTMIS